MFNSPTNFWQVFIMKYTFYHDIKMEYTFYLDIKMKIKQSKDGKLIFKYLYSMDICISDIKVA